MTSTSACTCPQCWGLGVSGATQCGYCGGLGTVPDVMLSEHFAFSEWCRPHVGCPNGAPGDAVTRARLSLLRVIEPGRALLAQRMGREVALVCHSGYRCPQLDVLADGGNTKWLTQYSAHALGSAFDLAPADPNAATLKQLLEAMRDAAAAGAGMDQVIAEGGCIHAAYEGPDDHGAPMPPSMGRRRGQTNARVRDATGSGYHYEVYVGTPEQWARIV